MTFFTHVILSNALWFTIDSPHIIAFIQSNLYTQFTKKYVWQNTTARLSPHSFNVLQVKYILKSIANRILLSNRFQCLHNFAIYQTIQLRHIHIRSIQSAFNAIPLNVISWSNVFHRTFSAFMWLDIVVRFPE